MSSPSSLPQSRGGLLAVVWGHNSAFTSDSRSQSRQRPPVALGGLGGAWPGRMWIVPVSAGLRHSSAQVMPAACLVRSHGIPHTSQDSPLTSQKPYPQRYRPGLHSLGHAPLPQGRQVTVIRHCPFPVTSGTNASGLRSCLQLHRAGSEPMWTGCSQKMRNLLSFREQSSSCLSI